jgi:basic membrane protein A and related proteins
VRSHVIRALAVAALVSLAAACSPSVPTDSGASSPPSSVPVDSSTLPSLGPAASAAPSPIVSAHELRVGLVAAPGSLTDNAYNQSTVAGLAAAAAAAPTCFQTDGVATKSVADAAADIKGYADGGYDVVIGVGQSLGDSLGDVALSHPGVKFIGVDTAPGPTHDGSWAVNGESLFFAEDQQGYLAGTLAALLSRSHNVGVVGGLLLVPQVESSVEGFLHGAAESVPGTTVEFAYTDSFTDPAQGGAAAKGMIAKGADVIFSTGSPTGDGALLAACKAGVLAIGSDNDQALSLPKASACLVSSAMKDVGGALTAALLRLAGGSFTPGFHTDDVASGGVLLAPGHQLASDITATIQARLDATLRGLADGSIRPDVVVDGKTP